MRKIVCIACLFCSLYTVAQNTPAHSLMATVYIIRATGFGGSAVNFRAWANDSVICRISNNHYSVHELLPKNYTFYVSSFDKYKMKENGFEMQVEAGKTYYLRMVIKTRFFESILYLQEITENSAAPLLSKCKPDKNCGG